MVALLVNRRSDAELKRSCAGKVISQACKCSLPPADNAAEHWCSTQALPGQHCRLEACKMVQVSHHWRE